MRAHSTPPLPGRNVKVIKIGPGEHYVTRYTDEVVVTVLGSCVSACVRDPMAGVGGMNHFMLPESDSGIWGGASANMRYGNFAMEQLINDIMRMGGARNRMEIKVFGGAHMMANGAMIGHQNADFVEAYLKAENMRIEARHLRGEHARRIEYTPRDGKVRLLEINLVQANVAQTESRYFDRIRVPKDTGDIELFD
jgi:chemotaxis protein CheD